MVPGIIEIICFSLIIYGLSKYDYCICIFGAIWSGIHMLLGLIWLFIIWYIIYIVVLPLIYFICLFSFNVVLIKKIAQIRNNGQQR